MPERFPVEFRSHHTWTTPVDHLGNLGVEIVRRDETTDTEASDVSAWLAS